MAEEKQQQTAKVKKGAKKSFFEVQAPMISTKIQLYAASAEELAGKVVRLDLTRILKGKNFELRLKVVNDNGVLTAEPVGLELIGSYIRRMMRTGIDYVEDSFVCEAKDGKARVKTFFITRNKVSRGVRREIRNVSRKFVEEYVKARSAKEVFSEVMTNRMPRDLFVRLKKIYPLALCEVRVFELA